MIFLFNKYEELQRILDQTSEVWNTEVNETLEGLFTFQFEMSGEHEVAQAIEETWLVGIEDVDGKGQLFRIVDIEEDHGADFTKTITCEHIVTDLLDIIIENEFIDRKRDDVALDTILGYADGWEVGDIEVAEDRHTFTIEMTNVLECLKTFSDRWGSEIAFEVEFTGTGIGRRFVHSYQQRGNDTGKRFDFDNDLESVRRTTDLSSIKTAMYGTAKEKTEEGEEGQENTEEEKVTFENVLWTTEPVTTNLLTPNQAKAENTEDGFFPYSPSGNFTWELESWSKEVGDYSLKLTNTSGVAEDLIITTSKERTPVEPNEEYTFSCYTRVNQRGGRPSRIDMFFYDANNNRIGSSSSGDFHNSDAFERHSVTFTTPTNTVEVYADLVCPSENGISLYYDKGQLEKYHEPTAWLEGGQERTWGGKPVEKPLGQKWIGDEQAREVFGRVVNGTKTHKFGVFDSGSAMTPEELLEETWRQLDNVRQPLTQYEVKAVDLNKLTGLDPIEVRLGDIVSVVDHDLNLKIKARVIERRVDLLQPELAEFKLGNFLPYFSNKVDQISLAIEQARRDFEDKLDKGDVIRTEWLEEEIELLNNLIRAGQGTVTMSENNGILVTDQRDNPSRALRLLGGVFAIANQKNADGSWNWSTFGTGDGFSARHINTETMRFDRLQGGKLKLGGAIDGYYENDQPIYQNGILEVYDEEGNLSVELTGNNRGFDYLNVQELFAPNVVRKTMNMEDLTIFVDVLNGQDGNEGTEQSPKRSIQGALDDLPTYLTANITIRVVNKDAQWGENVHISGFLGEGKLYIELGERNTLQGSIYARHVTIETWVSTDGSGSSFDNRATINSWNVEGWRGTIDVEACNYFFIYGVKVTQKSWNESGNPRIYYGINGKSTRIRLQDVEVYDTESSGIMIQYSAIGIIRNCYGVCPSGVRNYGAVVMMDGTIPNGTGSDLIEQMGAVTGGSWSAHSGTRFDPPPPRQTLTLLPYDTQSFRDYTNGWADDWRGEDVIYQGEYEYYGNHIGVMLFSLGAIGDALTNPDGSKRRVVSARLRLTRFPNGGSSSKGYPTFWTTTATQTGGSAPRPPLYNSWKSSVGWSWGDTHWVNLPTSMIDALYNGHTGLATYTSSGNPYLRWFGRGYANLSERPQLEIVHE